MAKAKTAYEGANNTVIYEYADGRREEWAGGDRNWRNQNPGNVFYYASNDWEGQIGWAGPIVIFDDPEKGRRATRKILAVYSNRKMTLAEGIKTYAPQAGGNNTEAYIRDVEQRTKISRDTRLNVLTSEQMENIAQAIFIHEGGMKPGTIKQISPSDSPRTGKYIWHTMRDGKVRKEHARYEGKTFDFAVPPDGGNPGAAYGCRCWAEPIPERSLKEILKK